uniref:Uncharacterized protein n=1 Tax=Anguilla anguilla TaxID=7936 RepID=A0A0E9WQS9_ANGAN
MNLEWCLTGRPGLMWTGALRRICYSLQQPNWTD